MDVTPHTKHTLRLELQARRRCMSGEARARQSRLILQQLIAWPAFQSAQRIGVYLAMPDEVDTAPIIDYLLEAGHPLAVPLYDPETETYHFAEFGRETALVDGAFGVREPAHPIPVPSDGLDLLLLPGRGFDRVGNRLGRGGGHIDALITGFYGITAGLAFDWQIVDEIPLEPHDQALQAVVTATEVLAWTPAASVDKATRRPV